jgi:hypothetical protein
MSTDIVSQRIEDSNEKIVELNNRFANILNKIYIYSKPNESYFSLVSKLSSVYPCGSDDCFTSSDVQESRMWGFVTNGMYGYTVTYYLLFKIDNKEFSTTIYDLGTQPSNILSKSIDITQNGIRITGEISVSQPNSPNAVVSGNLQFHVACCPNGIFHLDNFSLTVTENYMAPSELNYKNQLVCKSGLRSFDISSLDNPVEEIEWD